MPIFEKKFEQREQKYQNVAFNREDLDELVRGQDKIFDKDFQEDLQVLSGRGVDQEILQEFLDSSQR